MPADDLTSPELFSPLDFAIAERDRKTLDMVRAALKRDEGMLAYQPVVSADEPERIAFYEGLIRVRDETGRIIPAKDFIGVTEANEIGRMIDCLSLRLGLKALAASPEIRLSVNMSARSIGYAPWTETLRAGLCGDPNVAERLILEISESSAMLMPDVVSAFMDDLQLKGVGFALDGFGAGCTAFQYLKDFFFDAIKIDGRFIEGIASSPVDQAVVRGLISIGHHLEMFTVAERVTNAEDAAFLTAAGIDCLQGFHCGVPTLREPWLPMETARTA